MDIKLIIYLGLRVINTKECQSLKCKMMTVIPMIVYLMCK